MQSLNSPTIPARSHPRPGSLGVPSPMSLPRLHPPCDAAPFASRPASEPLRRCSPAPGAARHRTNHNWRASHVACEPVAPRRVDVDG